MNLANLTLLRDTLNALPPTIHFDMNVGNATHSCGTAACIAGVCHLLAYPDCEGHFNGWSRIQGVALRWLDLPSDETRRHRTNIEHDLFDYDLALDDCTPQQAAKAVQNVMEGLSPWSWAPTRPAGSRPFVRASMPKASSPCAPETPTAA